MSNVKGLFTLSFSFSPLLLLHSPDASAQGSGNDLDNPPFSRYSKNQKEEETAHFPLLSETAQMCCKKLFKALPSDFGAGLISQDD